MISKIIQKEKERQDRYFVEIKEVSELNKNYVIGKMDCHKQSIINLKEYMEEELEEWTTIPDTEIHLEEIEEDIKELNKMIERYE